MTAPKPLRR